MKALLLCASHNDLGLIRSLRKIGYEIICTGNRRGLAGEKYVDEYIQMDYSDQERVLALAREREVDAIVQCCNDYGVYTAAYVAEKLGLPGYDPYETILTLHNKDRFKAFAKEHGILTCNTQCFGNMEEALTQAEAMDLPIIVKPSDASAGNGIHKIEKREEARGYIQDAFEYSRNGRIVIEPFLEGSQHGFCTFLKDKKVIVYCSNDEYSMINPYRVEIDTYPASDHEDVHKILISQIEKMADILNLKDGIFHLQYINVNGKPYILEVMRRILGNMYSVPSTLLNGFDWDYWETRCRCGLSIDQITLSCREEGFYAYKTLVATKNGTIKKIELLPEYEKYVIGKHMIRKPGDRIDNYKSQPVGFLFMMFSSKEEMLRVLIKNYANGMVVTDETFAGKGAADYGKNTGNQNINALL